MSVDRQPTANTSGPLAGAAARPHAAGLSLRLRLMLLLLAALATIQVSTSIVALVSTQRTANALMEERLAARADEIAARLAGSTPPYSASTLAFVSGNEARSVIFDQLMMTVYDAQGTAAADGARVPIPLEASVREEALTSDRPIGSKIDMPAATTAPGSTGTTVMRVVARGFTVANGRRYVLVLATPDTFVQSLWTQLSLGAVIATPIGLLAAAIAGWLIAGIAVRPLQRLIQFAAGLRPDNLQEPIDIGGSRASELTDLQSELDRMRQRLETGYEAQERFVANVSHEIKTPIATVLTEAQTLPKGLTVPGDVRQFIESTQDEMRRLGRLVESFLMLTRVRHGKPLESTARTVGVNDVVMDSIQHCWKTAEQHSVHLLPELALEGDRELKVRGDPDLLRTMVDNLIRNAIRFSPKDQPIPIIVRHDGDHVSVCVHDKGPGIPPELVDKIFDRFSQAKSEEKLGRGSGLGLEIAQGIAELHGGGICVSNLDGGGCEFCATLPLLPVPQHMSPTHVQN